MLGLFYCSVPPPMGEPHTKGICLLGVFTLDSFGCIGQRPSSRTKVSIKSLLTWIGEINLSAQAGASQAPPPPASPRVLSVLCLHQQLPLSRVFPHRASCMWFWLTLPSAWWAPSFTGLWFKTVREGSSHFFTTGFNRLLFLPRCVWPWTGSRGTGGPWHRTCMVGSRGSALAVFPWEGTWRRLTSLA